MLELTAWHWFILACILLAIEVTMPVTFFLWLAGAALASSLTSLIFTQLSWQVEVGLFGIYTFASIVAWAYFRPKQPAITDQPALSQRNEQYLNKTVIVCQEIKGGTGKVKVDDSIWRAVGEDAKIGTKVVVRRVDGSTFHVEPA